MDPITICLGLMTGFARGGKTLLEISGVIESELTTLKAICRTDLLSSFTHFEKGIQRLNLMESEEEELELKEDRKKLAQESFMEADLEASNAFNNKSLKIEERIVACWIRIVSTILRHCNDSKLAEKDSMVYLKELHSLPEVKKMFSKMKQAHLKDQRAKNVDNVIKINILLANFIFNNPSSRKRAVLDWPMIQFDEQKFHPLYCKDVEGITHSSTPWYEYHFCKDQSDLFVDKEMTLNSEEEMLIFSENNLQKLDAETGTFQPWCKESCKIEDWQVRCMTVDNNDVVYVLSGCGRKHTWNYVLTIFSIDGTVQQSPLKFIENKDARSLCMAVTQDERIVVAFVEGEQSNITVCGCYKDGQTFLEELNEKGKPAIIVGDIKSLTVSDNTLAIILFREERFRKFHKLLTFNMEGDQKKAVKFHPNLKGIRVYDEVIYTPAVHAITGYYFNVTNANLVIEIISTETAKHKLSLVLMKTEYDPVFIDSIRLVHHVDGQVALVTKERTLHLKRNFALEESCMSNENRRRKSMVKKKVNSSSKFLSETISNIFSLEKLPENLITVKNNFSAKMEKKTADNSELKEESKSASSEGSSKNPDIEEPEQLPVANIVAQFEKKK